MIIAGIIFEAFQISLFLGIAVVFFIAIINLFNLCVNSISVVFFTGIIILELLHKLFLKVTFQHIKYKEYYD